MVAVWNTKRSVLDRAYIVEEKQQSIPPDFWQCWLCGELWAGPPINSRFSLSQDLAEDLEILSADYPPDQFPAVVVRFPANPVPPGRVFDEFQDRTGE